ncbi:MAG: FolB domain-containing protein [Chitinivibrionales bacterium]|nr:FolB domain-containing protein [Chitinivibrionales bacterium]
MKSKATIHITNLALRTIVGANDWERNKKQDVIINIAMTFDPSEAIDSDDIHDTLDYKKIKHRVVNLVENSRYYLLEKLTASIAGSVMENERVIWTSVRVDKPHALRFADSVSVEIEAKRK